MAVAIAPFDVTVLPIAVETRRSGQSRRSGEQNDEDRMKRTTILLCGAALAAPFDLSSPAGYRGPMKVLLIAVG